MDQPPATLNPRMSLDAAGQRIDALLFSSLTQLGPDLQVLPDLATKWKADTSLTRWSFKLAPSRTDHEGAPITADRLIECFNHYVQAKPRALAVQALAEWSALEHQGETLTFTLKKPDPHFPRNVTLLRYFRNGTEACTEPKSAASIVGSGAFRAKPFELSPTTELMLERRNQDGAFVAAGSFVFVRDENTRTLRLIRGEANVAQNTFSPIRTRWLQKNYGSKLSLTEAPGVNVTYLAFNLKDPVLKDVRVRRAIAHAIPLQPLLDSKMAGMGEIASSFLAPSLDGSFAPTPYAEDLNRAAALLDEAGYLKDPQTGLRSSLRLTFKTTPVRDGYEVVRVIQDALRHLGVRLELEVVEPAVFLASVRKGHYQLSLGRWIGVADSSILERTLLTGHASNRAGYSDPEMDRMLAQAHSTLDPKVRNPVLARIQQKMMDELPYLPLWFWKNAILHDRRFKRLEASRYSKSGALAPLFELREE